MSLSKLSSDLWNLLWSHFTYAEMEICKLVCWDWYNSVYSDTNPRKHNSVIHNIYGYSNMRYIEDKWAQFIQEKKQRQIRASTYPINHVPTDLIYWQRRGLSKSLITSYYWPYVTCLTETSRNRYRIHDLSTGEHIWELFKPMVSTRGQMDVNSNNITAIYQESYVEIWDFNMNELLETIFIPDIDRDKETHMKYYNNILYILGPNAGLMYKDKVKCELKYTQHINDGYVQYSNIIHDYATGRAYDLSKYIATSDTQHICKESVTVLKELKCLYEGVEGLYKIKRIISNDEYLLITVAHQEEHLEIFHICCSKGKILWIHDYIQEMRFSPTHPHLHTLTCYSSNHSHYIIIDLSTGNHLYHSIVADEHSIAYLDRNIVIFECNYFTDLEYYRLDPAGIPIYDTINYVHHDGIDYKYGSMSLLPQTEIVSYGYGYIILHRTLSRPDASQPQLYILDLAYI